MRSRTTTTCCASTRTSALPTRCWPACHGRPHRGGMEPVMRVLGLDPGSRRTGYGLVEKSGNRLRCVVQGAIAPPARLDLPHRLHAIAAKAGELIESGRPDVVVIEQAFYHESARSTLVLGHVRGALLVAAVQRGVEVAE